MWLGRNEGKGWWSEACSGVVAKEGERGTVSLPSSLPFLLGKGRCAPMQDSARLSQHVLSPIPTHPLSVSQPGPSLAEHASKQMNEPLGKQSGSSG